jgi:hypothetical protein
MSSTTDFEVHPHAHYDAPEACDMNLGPRQRKRRLRMGLFAGVAALGLTIPLLLNDSPGWVRAAAPSPLFSLSFIGFFQYRAKTCVRLAAFGVRNLDQGPEKLRDDDARKALQRRALGIGAQALASTAVVVTGLYFTA